MPQIEPVSTEPCLLGEGPVWDDRSGCVFWVDIKNPAIHSLHLASGARRRWPMPARIGAIGMMNDAAAFVGAFEDGFAFIDLNSNAVTPIVDPEASIPSNRFNDGKVDPKGRFWAGTMDDRELESSGHLYCLDTDLSVRKFELGFMVTNGIEWSNDGRIVYIVDSSQRRIFAYEFDMASGTVGGRRLFAAVSNDAGFPDGLTVDRDDHVWSAHWGGARVTRYRPDGTIERVLAFPAPLCTSCCFGGPDLDTLYVTSARIGLDDETKARFPLSGLLFAVSGLGVTGRKAGRFHGRISW